MPRRRKAVTEEELQEVQQQVEQLPETFDKLVKEILPDNIARVLLEREGEEGKELLRLAIMAKRYQLYEKLNVSTLLQCVDVLNYIRVTFLEPVEATALATRIKAPIEAITAGIKSLAELQKEAVLSGSFAEEVYRAVREAIEKAGASPEARREIETKKDILTEALTKVFYKILDKFGDEIVEELKKYGISEEVAKLIITAIKAGATPP